MLHRWIPLFTSSRAVKKCGFVGVLEFTGGRSSDYSGILGKSISPGDLLCKTGIWSRNIKVENSIFRIERREG